MTDVSTSGAQTNYALVYNGSSWAPAAQSGSSSSSSEYYSAHIQNISDIGLYGGYTITDSENITTQYNASQAFTFESYNPNWTGMYSASGKYNTTTGVYTGSASTEGVSGAWIQIDFGKKVKVHYYQIRAQGEQGSGLWNAPKEFTLFGSDNGSSWTNLGNDTKTIQDYNGNGNNGGYPLSQAFYVQTTLSSPATYRYFRLVVTKNFGNNSLYSEFSNGGTNGNLELHYLGFYGTFEEPDLIKGAISVNSVQSVDTSIHSVNVTGVWRRWGVAQGGTSGGLEASITPQSSSSKVKISLSLTYGYNTDTTYAIRIIRTIGGVSVPIMLGAGSDTAAVADNTTYTTAQNATFSLVTEDTANIYHTETTSFTGLDEPGTTSPVTYHIQIGSYNSSTRTIRFNRSISGGNNPDGNTFRSTMILEEFSTFTHNIAEQKVQGRVLETLSGVCDGRTVSVSSGSYTLPNVTTYLESSSSSWQTLTGSEISYKPPPGTKQVIYTLSVKTGYASDSHIMQFAKFYIDGQEVTNSYAAGFGETGQHYGGLYQFKYVVDIGTNDITNGRISSWDSLKTLKIEVRSYGTSYDIKYHWNTYKLGNYSTSSDQQLCRPTLEIQAIGEENLVYNLTNQYSITEGQVLETLAGVCDGRTVTVSSGTYTLQNVTAAYDTTTSWSELTGSTISYKPPPGTSQLVFDFKFNFIPREESNTTYEMSGLFNVKLYIDNTAFDASLDCYQTYNSYGSDHSERMFYRTIIDIGQINDITNGKVASWDTFKTLQLRIADYSSTQGVRLHVNRYGGFPGNSSATYSLVKPNLTIQAIGRGVIEGTIGNLYSSKVNMVTVQDGEKRSFVTPRTEPGVEIPSLRLTIKPIAADSIIELKWNLFCEAESNSIFRVTRNYNGTDVQVYDDTHGYTGAGIGIHTWDTDDGRTSGSTPQINTVRWYDKPGTTETITYKLFVGQSYYTASQNYSFWLNQTIGGGTNAGHENGVSTGVAIEHPQQTIMHNPRYNSVIEQEGQVLETLAGVCDGRTVTVSSGTYTLENVTARQLIPSSDTAVTGSTIYYKPPPGTRQVIYTLYFAFSTVDTARTITHYKFFFDDTSVTLVKKSMDEHAYRESKFTYKIVLEINGTNDIANGKIASWDSLKKLHVYS